MAKNAVEATDAVTSEAKEAEATNERTASRKLSYDPLLKKLIDAKLSKTELAAKVGISRTTLAKIGKNEPVSIDVLLRICDELDCDIVDVISYLPVHDPAGN
ncbi:MAG: helix-turn-helix transcriptional regulator [Clostridiales bacterium]|nr:helix-turn-helix transcriptional regulator [Clostridiales bacterium]